MSKSIWIILFIIIGCCMVPLRSIPVSGPESGTQTAVGEEEGNKEMAEEISTATGLTVYRAKSIEAVLLMAGKKDASGFILGEDASGESYTLSFTSGGQLFRAVLSRNMFVEYILDSEGNLVFAVEQ